MTKVRHPKATPYAKVVAMCRRCDRGGISSYNKTGLCGRCAQEIYKKRPIPRKK